MIVVGLIIFGLGYLFGMITAFSLFYWFLLRSSKMEPKYKPIKNEKTTRRD